LFDGFFSWRGAAEVSSENLEESFTSRRTNGKAAKHRSLPLESSPSRSVEILSRYSNLFSLAATGVSDPPLMKRTLALSECSAQSLRHLQPQSDDSKRQTPP
jgi:hypothetical protein